MEVAGSNPAPAVTRPADCNSAPAAAPSEVKNAIENLQGRVSNLVVEDGGKIRVRRKTVEDVLEECQRTFELIRTYGFHEEDDEEADEGEEDSHSRGTGQAEAVQCADSERAQVAQFVSRMRFDSSFCKLCTLNQERSGKIRTSSVLVLNKGKIRVRRKTVEDILEECQRTIEFIRTYGFHEEDDEEGGDGEEDSDSRGTGQAEAIECSDSERAQLCDLLKSRVESPAFLDKVETLHASIAQGILERAADEANSWDLVTETDLLEGEYNDARNSLDQESYVLVREEDILEGIACFMATYLSTVKDTKDLSPKQLQKALSKTFSVRKRKGKLRMMWDSSKVIYNVVSWGATAVGIYQNPALFRAASVAFWTTCRVVSKLM